MPIDRHHGNLPSQLPAGDAVFLDHVGHFVADPGTASCALASAGFSPTPVSVQVNPDPAGGAPRPTGTGNVCAMLEHGYLEVLFKTADTPLGREFDLARARYDGLHLAAFAIANADRQHARLSAAGFELQPLVKMQRPVATADGEGVAGFEVVRVGLGQMQEGRIQMLRHLTEETVWQPRWLAHPNTAVALVSLTIVAADVDEAAARYRQFLDRPTRGTPEGQRIDLERGTIELITPQAWHSRWPQIELPSLPFMGECRIGVRSLHAAEAALRTGGVRLLDTGERLAAAFPGALGAGVWRFVQCP